VSEVAGMEIPLDHCSIKMKQMFEILLEEIKINQDTMDANMRIPMKL
jgi:hypothetical protein